MRYIKPPDFKSVKELEEYYKKVEQDITDLLTRDGSARTSKELNEKLSLALNAAVAYLAKANNRFAKDELSTAFKEGQDGVKEESKVSAKEAADLLEKQGYKYAKNGLYRDTYIELQTATKEAGNGLKSRVNSIIDRLSKTGQDIVYNVQQAIVKDLQENGLFTVRYANGSKQPLHAYAAMAARSARIESTNIGAIGRAIQAGTDYVKMTSVPQCCKLCGAYQGKVYCISGKDKRFPALFKTVLKKGYALPHPNCRHEFIPWFIEMEDPADVEKAIQESKIKYDKQGNLLDVRYQKDIKSYAAWQAGNRQLNNEYLEYERMKAYYAEQGQEPPYKSLGAFRREVRKPAERQAPAIRAWKRHVPDKQQYERWKGIVGERYMPKTVDEFQQIKYNRDRQQEFEKLRQIRAQEIDYKVAETGGAHSGKLADYQKNFSIAALEKTVKNLDEKIALHIDKINNPEQHYPDWSKRNLLQQEGSIKHWRKEIANFQKQKNIALAELRRRRIE